MLLELISQAGIHGLAKTSWLSEKNHDRFYILITASNGDPSNPQSLHFNQGHYANQYVQAIQAVGDIVQDYDTDKVNFYSLGRKLFRNFSSFQFMDLVLEFLHKVKFPICSRVISILQIRLFMVFKVLSTFIKIQSVKFNCMDRPTSLQ